MGYILHFGNRLASETLGKVGGVGRRQGPGGFLGLEKVVGGDRVGLGHELASQAPQLQLLALLTR